RLHDGVAAHAIRIERGALLQPAVRGPDLHLGRVDPEPVRTVDDAHHPGVRRVLPSRPRVEAHGSAPLVDLPLEDVSEVDRRGRAAPGLRGPLGRARGDAAREQEENAKENGGEKGTRSLMPRERYP